MHAKNEKRSDIQSYKCISSGVTNVSLRQLYQGKLGKKEQRKDGFGRFIAKIFIINVFVCSIDTLMMSCFV